jgi:hypothetical protein
MLAQDHLLCRREQIVWNDYCSVAILFLDQGEAEWLSRLQIIIHCQYAGKGIPVRASPEIIR